MPCHQALCGLRWPCLQPHYAEPNLHKYCTMNRIQGQPTATHQPTKVSEPLTRFTQGTNINTKPPHTAVNTTIRLQNEPGLLQRGRHALIVDRDQHTVYCGYRVRHNRLQSCRHPSPGPEVPTCKAQQHTVGDTVPGLIHSRADLPHTTQAVDWVCNH